MKKLFLLLHIVYAVSYCQPFHKQIFTQTYIVPGDSLSTIFFLYRVPYQNLVFQKNENQYTAQLRLYLEVTDTNSKFVDREIKDWDIRTNLFEQTSSSEIFAEGMIKIELANGSYNILPIVTDKNSRELKLENVRIDVSNKKYREPLIVDAKKIRCDGQDFLRLTNFENSLPFGSEPCDFIIPVSDISEEEIFVTVISGIDTVYYGKVITSFVSNLDFFECDGKILLSERNEGIKTRNYVLPGISNKLQEGTFTIVIDENKDANFKKDVFWYDKPVSLRNPEEAVKAIKNIENEDVVDSLLSQGEELIYKALVGYWKKIDPTPETEYNELMAEFYTRVDYTLKNFGSITGVKGVESDRGKIFVKFGKPNKIERSSNLQGKVVETWIYDKLQRKFVFVDKDGTGEFSLESS